jgi:hypothetical protein
VKQIKVRKIEAKCIHVVSPSLVKNINTQKLRRPLI